MGDIFDKSGKYIDLHLHLDGAIDKELARELADIEKVALPALDAELETMLTLPPVCESLNDFLKCFELPDSLLQREESLTYAVRRLLDKMRDEGLIYAEIRFAPQLHMRRGMSQEDAVRAAIKGLEKAEIPANLILCAMRGSDCQKANYETMQLAKKYLNCEGGVAAMDLAGAEALFPTRDYRELFMLAKNEGLPFTIHAGEADGPESVREAVDYGASRIGHGVRMAADEEVCRLVKERGIYLEMCPTSNRQTQALADMSLYPLRKFLDEGIKVTINTDDPAIEGTSISKEFNYIADKFGFSYDDYLEVSQNAIEGAFASDAIKANLRSKLSAL